MTEAEERLIEAHRAAELRSQAERWSTAQLLRRYCDAMELEFGNQPATAEWIDWARSYILRLDPLDTPPAMPEAPEITTQKLQQFLPDGWSALGPGYSGYR